MLFLLLNPTSKMHGLLVPCSIGLLFQFNLLPAPFRILVNGAISNFFPGI
jgi:hypothetical protein